MYFILFYYVSPEESLRYVYVTRKQKVFRSLLWVVVEALLLLSVSSSCWLKWRASRVRVGPVRDSGAGLWSCWCWRKRAGRWRPCRNRGSGTWTSIAWVSCSYLPLWFCDGSFRFCDDRVGAERSFEQIKRVSAAKQPLKCRSVCPAP